MRRASISLKIPSFRMLPALNIVLTDLTLDKLILEEAAEGNF